MRWSRLPAGPAGRPAPQPRPGRLRPFRFVAAQLPGQPGDHHRVFRIGLVPGQVLRLPGLPDQRQSPARPPAGPVPANRCPVGSHATVTDANPAAVARSTAQSSSEPRAPTPGTTPVTAPPPASRDRTPPPPACHRPGRSRRSRAAPAAAPRIRPSPPLRLQSPRDKPVPSTTDVLLDAWATKPETASGGRPTSNTDALNALLAHVLAERSAASHGRASGSAGS